ncbi:phosphoribosyltransferase-like protein [Pectobacterium brasiliense]|uniref:phosphoribosyltransferase-like protein n=1 Tax=Pectobacterium brasiliense TaxID=180957 RepID=UPI0025A01EB9|nr:hypothetical protein [Pectobacterium brasiliense]WJM81636.1 hypothetical protein QTI90_02435 [Pectobacterium brasiliense]
MKINISESYDDDIASIFQRAHKLIDLKYWDNVSHIVLDNWIRNFRTREERYLAAAILHSIIFRNKQSIITMGHDIFQFILPQILEENGIHQINSIENWLEELNSRNFRKMKFRFSAIDDIDDNAVKSSSNILSSLKETFFDKTLAINSHRIKNFTENGVKAIIFFDDIIGTGTQFEDFYKLRKLDELKEVKIIYIPFAAVKDTVIRLQKTLSNVIISPVEIIDDTHNFFCESNDFLSFMNDFNYDEFRSFYLDVCKAKKINLHGNLGVGELSLTYIFSSSTPNNNLAMLMHRDTSWSGLFKR